MSFTARAPTTLPRQLTYSNPSLRLFRLIFLCQFSGSRCRFLPLLDSLVLLSAAVGMVSLVDSSLLTAAVSVASKLPSLFAATGVVSTVDSTLLTAAVTTVETNLSWSSAIRYLSLGACSSEVMTEHRAGAASSNPLTARCRVAAREPRVQGCCARRFDGNALTVTYRNVYQQITRKLSKISM